MAKKKQTKKALAYKRQLQKAQRPGVRLQEARQALEAGELAKALNLAEDAHRALRASAADPATIQQAQGLLAELHFRLAEASAAPALRLQHLDAALALTPDQARLHYQRGLTLWRMGKPHEAAPAFERVAQLASAWPGIAYLRQLGKLATGQPWSVRDLSPAERDTLQLLHDLLRGKDAAQIQAGLGNLNLGGGHLEMWCVLLNMATNPKAAPLDELQNLIRAGNDNPILHYYQGVAAQRKGDLAAAHLAWNAAARTLATPQLNENLLLLRRDLAVQYAQEGRWEEVAQIYESIPAASTGLSSQPDGPRTGDPVLEEMAGLAYYQLGYAAAQRNEWSQALALWRPASNLMASRALSQNLALAEEALGNWAEAATAWRDMIRRRPRKADHPDALTDAQVAAIWQHIAQCYQQIDDGDEVITCLKNAIKYAPDDLDLRITLADTLRDEGRVDAAENELERILEQNADYLPALLRLGVVYTGRWGRDPKPVWEHVLQLDPDNSDAQEALAMIYLGLATHEPNLYSHLLTMEHHTFKQALAILETGLNALPEHPLLLSGMGQLYRQHKQDPKARQAYERAIHSALARKNLKLVDMVLHELLHVDGGQVVRAVAPEVNRFPGLLARFWVDQGERAMDCKLGEQWARFFWDEAVHLAESAPGGNSLAATLLHVFDMAFHEDLRDLARTYEKRLRAQHPNSGAIEYIDATYLYENDPDKKKAVLTLLRRAKTAAQKSNEAGIVEMIESFEDFLRRPPNPFGGIGPGLIDLLKNLDKDELDVFRRLF